MLNKLSKILFFVLPLIFIGITYGYVASKRNELRCSSIKLVIVDSLQYQLVTKEDVKKKILEKYPNVFNTSMDSIRVRKIERLIKNIPSVKSVDVYSTIADYDKINGARLVIEIEQHEPILRVMSGRQQFYLNMQGETMPLSKSYSAHVAVASGYIKEKEVKDKLWPLAQFIYNDNFWRAQIEQIFVKRNEEVILVPRVGDHLIEMGKVSDFQTKLRNLKALYQKSFKKEGWNLYSKINLKFRNQVVCTKK